MRMLPAVSGSALGAKQKVPTPFIFKHYKLFSPTIEHNSSTNFQNLFWGSGEMAELVMASG